MPKPLSIQELKEELSQLNALFLLLDAVRSSAREDVIKRTFSFKLLVLHRKYFCKDDCKEEDILVETTGFRGQKGRYKIRYIKGFSTGGFVFVRITQLTQSDSGQYRCGLDRPSSQDPYQEFRIIVTDGEFPFKVD
uniref:Immunoglobulin V-set domain-containing protein n=1 Tax=Dicentrarchus labrax TaxID=13489 RepID=A0A8P4GIH2_DICLA